MSTKVYLVYFDDTQFGPSPTTPTLMKVTWSKTAAVRAAYALFEEQRSGLPWPRTTDPEPRPQSWRPHVSTVFRIQGGPNAAEPRYDITVEEWPVEGSPLEALAEAIQ